MHIFRYFSIVSTATPYFRVYLATKLSNFFIPSLIRPLCLRIFNAIPPKRIYSAPLLLGRPVASKSHKIWIKIWQEESPTERFWIRFWKILSEATILWGGTESLPPSAENLLNLKIFVLYKTNCRHLFWKTMRKN